MQFVVDPKYSSTNIWDLQYFSTSDEEDNDSEGNDDFINSDASYSESGEDEQEELTSEADYLNKVADKNLFVKNVKGQGENVPEIVRRLKPKKQRR